MYALSPICKYRIWGSSHLANEMNINTDCEKAGEIFCVNALPENDVLVDNTIPLSKFYQEHKNIFHIKCDVFPLRVNLIDAEDDLSIQVHPDDRYAKMYEHARGLPEAWVILNSDDGHIRLGHNCQSRMELEQIIKQEKILDVIPKIPVEKGMFFYLKPGTIHAIGKGVSVLEVSHMADITYRLDDYGRIDIESNQPRKLQIKKALDNIYYPQHQKDLKPILYYDDEHYEKITYFDEPNLFTIESLQVRDACTLALTQFCIIVMLSGNGRIDNTKVEKGQTWLKLFNGSLTRFYGEMKCMIITYKEM